MRGSEGRVIGSLAVVAMYTLARRCVAHERVAMRADRAGREGAGVVPCARALDRDGGQNTARIALTPHVHCGALRELLLKFSCHINKKG